MKSKFYVSTLFILSSLFLWTACSDSGTGTIPDDLTGESITYNLNAAEESSIDGEVILEERVNGDTQIRITLNDLDEGEEYLAGVYSNTVLDEGELLIDLESIEGSSGENELIVSANEDGETLSYDDLLEINGHIRIYLSGDSETILSSTDIGGNALTGESMDVALEEVDESGVNGEVEFLERRDGTILAVIELTGINGGEDLTAHLHDEENDSDLFTFQAFDSATGISRTNISEFDDGTPITFEELEELQAHIHVHQGDVEQAIIASGELGN